MDDLEEINRHAANGDLPAVLAALREYLDYRCELALDQLALLMIEKGATDEELERELEHHEAAFEVEAKRQVAEVEALIRREARRMVLQ